MPQPAIESVSEKRIVECEESARFWATNLGIYAQQMRRKAEGYAIATGVLGAVTGLGVWSTLAASTAWPAVLTVSAIGLVSMILSAVTGTKRYGECAGAAATLAGRYGEVLGDLVDARETIRKADPGGASRAQRAVRDFEKAKKQKDELAPFPVALQQAINDLRAKRMNNPAEPQRN
jgi:hypothetical protein